MKEKKVWVKPELVVLVRRKPEEGILQACAAGGSGFAWASDFSGCYEETFGCQNCSF